MDILSGKTNLVKTTDQGSTLNPMGSRVDSFSEGFWCSGKQTGSHKLLTLSKNGRKSTRLSFMLRSEFYESEQ